MSPFHFSCLSLDELETRDAPARMYIPPISPPPPPPPGEPIVISPLPPPGGLPTS